MLQIKLNSKLLDLADDISIDITATNPIFTESGFDEAFSYQFSVPRSSRNMAIFSKITNNRGSMSISYAGIQLLEGIAYISTNMDSYSVDFKNDSLNFKQKIENLNLKDINYDSIVVCNTADDVVTKRNKWLTHMHATAFDEAANEGTHKFPQITAWDATQDVSYFQDWDTKNSKWNFWVNRYAHTNYVINPQSPIDEDNPIWRTGCSPCPRAEYVLECILQNVSVILYTNELDSITEFGQLFFYSNLSMDAIDNDGTYQYNYFGEIINLIDFIPDKTVLEYFTLLDQLFGCFFQIKNGKFSIRMKKNILKVKPENHSKYADYSYTNDNRNDIYLTLEYPIETTAIDRFKNNIWISTVPDTALTTKQYNFFPDRNLYVGNEQTELGIIYTPLVSKQAIIDYIFQNYYASIDIEYTEACTWLHYPIKEPISSFYDTSGYADGCKDFIIGLFRGIYSFYNYDTEAWIDKVTVSNRNEMMPMINNDVNYKFGDCSLYFNDTDSHIDKYLKNYLNYLYRSDEVTKLMNWTIHIIIKQLTWEKAIHIIQQRNLSFKGILKEIKFTLNKSTISASTVKYAVILHDNSGDFNSDYNSDFNM